MQRTHIGAACVLSSVCISQSTCIPPHIQSHQQCTPKAPLALPPPQKKATTHLCVDHFRCSVPQRVDRVPPLISGSYQCPMRGVHPPGGHCLCIHHDVQAAVGPPRLLELGHKSFDQGFQYMQHLGDGSLCWVVQLGGYMGDAGG